MLHESTPVNSLAALHRMSYVEVSEKTWVQDSRRKARVRNGPPWTTPQKYLRPHETRRGDATRQSLIEKNTNIRTQVRPCGALGSGCGAWRGTYISSGTRTNRLISVTSTGTAKGYVRIRNRLPEGSKARPPRPLAPQTHPQHNHHPTHITHRAALSTLLRLVLSLASVQ